MSFFAGLHQARAFDRHSCSTIDGERSNEHTEKFAPPHHSGRLSAHSTDP